MIDVMKRLAELDAQNPNIVRESADLEECGPMGMMDGMGGAPNTPASINMTAASGEELSGMLKDIMSLAGLSKVEPEHLGMEPEPTVMTAEPVTAVGPAATDSDMMRSVIDKLNPEMDGDGDHDMDDHDAENDDEEEQEDEGQYDNSPADPTKPPAFDANEFAKQDNPQGGGETSNGEKRIGTQPTATFENLMKEYKKFIGESSEEEMDEAAEEDDEEMEEGIEDRLKDLDPKNPVNIPAYKRKAASGDSADAVRNTKEGANESMASMLKLAGLTK